MAERETLELIQDEEKLKIDEANVGTKSKPRKRSNTPESPTHLPARRSANLGFLVEINDTFVLNAGLIYTPTANYGPSGFTRIPRVLIRRC
jgi:hypothetical protein